MKLAPWSMITVGGCVGLSLVSFALFQHWLPNREETTLQKKHLADLQAEGAKMPLAQKRKQEAIATVNEETAKWNEIVKTHTPSSSLATGGIDVTVNPWQLTVDARRYRNSLQRAVNAQVKKGGATVITGPAIPPPDENASGILATYFNFPVYRFPVVIFDLGQVTVQGTYAQIKANVQAWSTMPNYLAVTDGLTLQGTSPKLTGTYRLTLLGYLRGKEMFPPVPEIGAGANNQPGGNANTGRPNGQPFGKRPQ